MMQCREITASRQLPPPRGNPTGDTGGSVKQRGYGGCRTWLGPLLLMVGTLQLSACAAPAGLAIFSAGTGVAMGTSVDYTLNGIAYKTFVAPMPTVRVATLNGLHRMGMTVVDDKKSDSGWTITATARERKIDIELEKLTPRTTRMRVVAEDGVIFKDRATEAAIIDEAADSLDRHATVRG